MTRARRSGGVSAQAGCAAFAAATAASTSAGAASATRRAIAPVAGLVTGCVRPLVPATRRPPMKWPMSAVLVKCFVRAHGRPSWLCRWRQRRRSIGVLVSSVSRRRNGSDGVLSRTVSGAFHISSAILLTIARSETVSLAVHSR